MTSVSKITFGTVLFLAILTSCHKTDGTAGPVPPVQDEFCATIDGTDGNTTLDGWKVLWEKGDTIIINEEKYTADRAGEMAYFKKAGKSATGSEYEAWYPTAIFRDSITELPAVQKYHSKTIRNCPMHAHSTGTTLHFKNLCGVFEISVKGNEGSSVTKMEMTSNKAMSGPFYVEDDAAVLTEEAQKAGAGVTLDCGTGVPLSYLSNKFYIAVPAGEYSGLSLKITVNTGTKDSVYTLMTANAAIARNTVYSSTFDTRGFPIELEFAASRQLTIVDDYIVNLGTIEVSNVDISEDFLAPSAFCHDSEKKGLCSAGGLITSKGELLIGRNYDMPLSYYPVYFFQTKGGKYRTFNAMYYHGYLFGSKTFQQIQNGGKPADYFINSLPGNSFDVFNEAGLYIELNMRYSESQFRNTGTKSGATRTSFLNLPQKLAMNCATVEEAVAMATNDLDIYDGIGYVLGCLIGDAKGDYGVLEAIGNKVYFSRDSANINFWVPAEQRAKEVYREGLGRGDVMRECLPSVENDSMMFALMDRVAYSKIYGDAFRDRSEWHYDIRSDYTEMWGKTTDWMLDEANFEEVSKKMKNYSAEYVNMTEEERRSCAEYWMPTITSIVNCTRKSIILQYAEDSSKRYVFHW